MLIVCVVLLCFIDFVCCYCFALLLVCFELFCMFLLFLECCCAFVLFLSVFVAVHCLLLCLHNVLKATRNEFRIFPELSLVCSDSQKALRNESRDFPWIQFGVF